MKNCPKCNTLMGDNVNICPDCGYEISEEENKRIKLEQQENEYRQQQQEFKEFVEERANKRLIYSAIVFLSAVASVGGAFILSAVMNNTAGFAISIIIGFVLQMVVIILGVVTGAFRCPYCDTILFKNFGRHCANCGNKLY